MPQPLGPTTPVSPGSISSSAGSTKLLKPASLTFLIRIEPEAFASYLERITEAIPAYRDDNVLSPAQVIHLAHMTRKAVMAKVAQPSVGLFGALEIEQYAGPLKAGVDYLARTKVLKFSESPKTENVWYRAWAADPDTGEDVGSMLMYLRYMKGSSKHYAA